MPCSDYREGERERQDSAYQAMELLCSLMRFYEGQGDDAARKELHDRLLRWWKRHQELDSIR